jgi:prevent-host-death family protein
MPEREPMTQIIKASDARAQWSQILNSVFRRQTRVIVEKSGIPVAAIVSAQDLERLNQWEQQREHDLAILEASQSAFKDVPEDELEREVAAAVRAVRAENRTHAVKPK